MLQNFFTWCSRQSALDGLAWLGLVTSIMLLIPNWQVITAFFRHILFPKKLRIESFGFHLYYLESGEEVKNIEEVAPDFLLKGSALRLSWRVTGAWRIDIDPIGRNLTGNAATIIFRGDCIKFTLKAHGFFQQPVVSMLEIPLSSAYRLEKQEINRAPLAVEPLPLVSSLPFSRMRSTGLAYTTSDIVNRDLTPQVSEIDPTRLITGKKEQKALYGWMERSKILRSYTFSTKKYPNTLH